MTDKEFKNRVIDFLVIIRTENSINEDHYDAISDYLLSHRQSWERKGSVSLNVFKACVDLMSSLAGGNRFLSENDQERLSSIEDEIYELLMEFE